jgi:uncharacterized protein
MLKSCLTRRRSDRESRGRRIIGVAGYEARLGWQRVGSSVSVGSGTIRSMVGTRLRSAVPTARSTETLTLAAARRIAIAAQGLGRRHPPDRPPPSRGRVVGAVRAQGILQIDSVNVVARAQYLPLFARLGDYPTAHLDEALWPAPGSGRPRMLFETWAHMASIVPIEAYPLLWWRRRDLANGPWGNSVLKDHPGLADRVLGVIADRGPSSAGEVSDLLSHAPGPGGWWGWSVVKSACEVLFASGAICVSYRKGFERFYDLTERVIPAEQLAATPPAELDAKRALIEIAARALGVATIADLADFYRMVRIDAATAVAELLDAGVLRSVLVEGWSEPAYLHVEARIPRSVSGAALLCPFDPLVWYRPRTQRLFDFHYRIEIYTPAQRRVHGYYVFPLLVGDRLVGRLDLKADRAKSALLVQAAWLEPGERAGPLVAEALGEVRRMTGWLGLDDVVVRPVGNFPLGQPG